MSRNWISDLRCRQARMPAVNSINEIQIPIFGCNNSIATSIEVIYPNPVKRITVVLGEACYSESAGRTLFIHTRHTSENLRFMQIPIRIENFDYCSMQQHPNQMYQTDFTVAFNWYKYGPNKYVKTANCVTLPKTFVEKEQFIKDNFFNDGQLYQQMHMGWNVFLTRYFNSNKSHLHNFERLFNDVMQLKRRNFDIYVGTHSFQLLKVENKRLYRIYLLPEERKYSLPKYIWMVVKTDSRRAVAFLILNDPKATDDDIARDELCESKCMKIKWLRNLLSDNSVSNVRNGYVWCCELFSFMDKVHEMPRLSGKYKLLV